MAYIIQKNVVFYACTCGILKPISKLYFCRHCLQMRCGFCVCHEVDSHFCGKCAENIPSSEARLKKNRCSSCYDCPCCQHQLSIRVSSANSAKNGSATVSSPSVTVAEGKATPEGKPVSRKVYYLSCSFCRWSTRDVGIPDKSSASGGWPERENVHSNRLNLIQEKYKAVVLWDKQQKLDKEKKKRGKYVTMTDKIGLSAAMIRKRVGLRELSVTPPKHSIKEISSAVAHEDVEGLPEDIFTAFLNLDEISTLEQRLLQPEWQPEKVNLLFPIHKHLSVKRSLRCRTCEHNVSKPEYNPNSIKFKIQLFAYYHIPEVRIVTVEPLRAGQISELIIKVCNPTQHQTSVTFLPITFENNLIDKNDDDDDDDDDDDRKVLTDAEAEMELTSDDAGQTSGSGSGSGSGPPSSMLHTSLTRQPSMTVEPRTIAASVSGDISLPESSVTILLPPRDDTAEYDDSVDTHNFQDDPKLVIWRKSNKVALKLKVTPSKDLNIGGTVLIGFKMKHLYVNTIATIENREPQKCDHFVKVFLELGKTVGSD